MSIDHKRANKGLEGGVYEMFDVHGTLNEGVLQAKVKFDVVSSLFWLLRFFFSFFPTFCASNIKLFSAGFGEPEVRYRLRFIRLTVVAVKPLGQQSGGPLIPAAKSLLWKKRKMKFYFQTISHHPLCFLETSESDIK